jgi:hypothetical protein
MNFDKWTAERAPADAFADHKKKHCAPEGICLSKTSMLFSKSAMIYCLQGQNKSCGDATKTGRHGYGEDA